MIDTITYTLTPTVVGRELECEITVSILLMANKRKIDFEINGFTLDNALWLDNRQLIQNLWQKTNLFKLVKEEFEKNYLDVFEKASSLYCD